eukprot:338648-Chlamydomonas_euryale.AAC.1
MELPPFHQSPWSFPLSYSQLAFLPPGKVTEHPAMLIAPPSDLALPISGCCYPSPPCHLVRRSRITHP